MSKLHPLFSIKYFILLLFTPMLWANQLAPISGRNVTELEIIPADVLARAELVKDELELIRLELGKPTIPSAEIDISNSSPREVYSEAIALFTKVNRLSFEHAKTTASPFKLIDINLIKPFHVWIAVNHSYNQLQLIKKKLNIRETSLEKKLPITTIPNKVIQSLFATNRLISHLLSNKVAPGDVYKKITESINVNANILSHFEGVERIPEAPNFVRRKTPIDVYERLYYCFGLLKKISVLSNLKTLDIKIINIRASRIPSDVYDLASIIESVLSYVNSNIKGSIKPAKAYFPGVRTPSHVYQRTGILEKQLTSILLNVEKNPSWLAQ